MDKSNLDGSSGKRWDLRLQEVIDTHIDNLRQDFQRLIGELPLQPPAGEAEPVGETLVRLRAAVDSIHASRSQREMASRLLDAAAGQAARAALFLARHGSCHGFDTRGFSGSQGDLSSFQASPPPTEPLGAAVHRQTTAHIPGTSLGGSVLAGWLAGQEPVQVCLAPVVVGERTVAVLYADSGPQPEGGRIHPEAVEILASVAGMYLERLRRTVTDARTPQAAAGARDERQTAPAEAPDPPPEARTEAITSLPPAAGERPPVRDPLAETVPLSDWSEDDLSRAADDRSPAAVAPLSSPPGHASPADDGQAGEDARRFARLLVSEIVLYNEAQVTSGRKKGDLYSRLEEPVTRSREAFVERFGTGLLDTFEQELVRTLAQGDAARMGGDNPGR